MSMVEGLLMEQMTSWVKSLPQLPSGWMYEFVPGVPKFNPEKDAWEATMEAIPKQKFVIKED